MAGKKKPVPSTGATKKPAKKIVENTPPKKRAGNPNTLLSPSERKVCGALSRKRGRCEQCGYTPVPDENDAYERHRGVCVKCGGAMRCQAPILCKNGRCKFHAGITKTPVLKSFTGYTRYLPRQLSRTYERVAKQPDRLSTQAEIDLISTLIVDQVRHMKGGEVWDDIAALAMALRQVLLDMDNPRKARKATANIASIVERLEDAVVVGKGDAQMREELLVMADTKSKIADREAKRLLNNQMYLDVEEGAALLVALTDTVVKSLAAVPADMEMRMVSLGTLTPEGVRDLLEEQCAHVRSTLALRVRELMNLGDRKPGVPAIAITHTDGVPA